jgi:hypothetical protein
MYSVDAGTKVTQRGELASGENSQAVAARDGARGGRSSEAKKIDGGRFAPPGLSGVGFGK